LFITPEKTAPERNLAAPAGAGGFPRHWDPVFCRTNTYHEFGQHPNSVFAAAADDRAVRSNKRHTSLPIGRAARTAFEIDAMRAACCKAAQALISASPIDEDELGECVRLDDALAQAHRLLKSTVREIVLSRLARRSRAQ
jgi:hypothetical protein